MNMQSSDSQSSDSQSITLDSKKNETDLKKEKSSPLNEQNSEPIDRVEFIRFLLSLTERLDKEKLELVSRTLCYELIKPTGLCNLINASIDLDESSQKVTTHNQRFIKLSLIIAGLPKLCCSLEVFYESISDQLIRILINITDDRQKESQHIKLISSLIVTICSALYRRSRKLFASKFLNVIFNCYFNSRDNLIDSDQIRKDERQTLTDSQKEKNKNFNNELEQDFVKKIRNELTNEKSISKRLKFENINESDESTSSNVSTCVSDSSSTQSVNEQKRIIRLRIDESIKIVLLLLMNHFERREIIRYFKQFFYMKCVLYETECSLNRNLDKLLNELLINIRNSYYLLDKTLFEKDGLDEFDRYLVRTDVERGVRTIVLRSSLDTTHKIESNEIELKKIDQITQCTVRLITVRPDAYQIDTFLLFLQRYSQKRTTNHQSSLLVCSLIDTLMKSIITPEGLIMLINFPEKAVDFVNLTLERLTLSYDTSIYELSTSDGSNDSAEEDEELKASIKNDSLNMCLQIIDFVLKKQLHQSIFENLKQTLDNFVFICSKGHISEEIRKKSVELQNELKTKSFLSTSKHAENSIFEQAIQDLNSNLMPDRAHALITLKKLIRSKNSNIESNKAQLITILKECIQDNESYIYLSAINTLAELALNYTDEVLPILIESFNDKNRPQMDRLKVGQVIVYLSKQLNELAHCHSKPIMNMLLRGSRDECDLIRVSTLSNLAEFCSVLKFKLNVYITELMVCIGYTLKSDPSIEVKRACVMFFHLLLNNLDQNSLHAIESELRNIYALLKHVYNTTLDDLIQLHAQLALEQLDRIAREILKSMNTIPSTGFEFRLK